jgi:RNA polymerase sigma-70 factor (sigma-E family)
VGTEPAGFRDWVAARQRRLLGTARLLTCDAHLAEDLVQTALLKVWPHEDRVVAAGDPEQYVRRVLVTTWSTWSRRRWRGEQPAGWPAPGDRDEPGSRSGPGPTAGPQPPVGDLADDVALRDALARLLPVLTPSQRAVIVLRYAEDLSEAQTADLLGISVGTVKSQAARALARLRAGAATAALLEER